jgi:hypothetical protein
MIVIISDLSSYLIKLLEHIIDIYIIKSGDYYSPGKIHEIR